MTVPAGSHSNVVLPPSCRSTLLVMIRVPNPVLRGGFVDGPPVSRQLSMIALGCTSQFSSSLPEASDSAPYFAALVASSCSASASVCAVAGSSRTFGPGDRILSALSPTGRRQLFIDQLAYVRALPARQSDRIACARDSALIRPSITVGVVGDAAGLGQSHDRLHDRHRVLGAVIDLARQQRLPLLGILALGDVHGHAADAHDLAGLSRVAAAVPTHQRISPFGR